jgi:CRP/FNR family transcriptional regulator, cyclic AMP receptor protein
MGKQAKGSFDPKMFLGLISYNGKIEVHNSLLSAVMHDKPEIKRDEATGKE